MRARELALFDIAGRTLASARDRAPVPDEVELSLSAALTGGVWLPSAVATPAGCARPVLCSRAKRGIQRNAASSPRPALIPPTLLAPAENLWSSVAVQVREFRESHRTKLTRKVVRLEPRPRLSQRRHAVRDGRSRCAGATAAGPAAS